MIKEILKKIYRKYNYVTLKGNLKKILNRNNKQKCTILIGSPLHGNIGDHAITIAQIKLLKKSKNKLIDIPGKYFELFKEEIFTFVKKNDTIVITGGGFIGTLWLNEENMIRNVIKTFPNNRVIIMPQTAFFEDSEYGKKQLDISKSIYNSHKDLHIFLRDKRSYDFCIEHFTNAINIKFVPDIVTYLNYEKPIINREDALFCLRKDKEKVLNIEVINNLEEIVKNKGLSIKETTTVVNRKISIEKRNKEFEDKLNEFKASKILITDRLHGMIFAAITATPCLAFDNLSGKVSGVYKWLENLDYIKVINNDEKNKEEIINNLLKIDCLKYNNESLKCKLEEILELIK